MVITRYLYKPDYSEGMSRFNDNQRLHIFVVDIASKQVKQLTQGEFDEHSIDWSPDGKKLVFASNREPNQDEFFNYDLFTLDLADNSIHRLTATEYCEYEPVWSPDGRYIAYSGTRRGLTDRETTMEDTHVWVMNADGSNRREIGAALDNRQGPPQWAADGSAVYSTIQERGSEYLVRLPVGSGKPEYVVKDIGYIGGWSVGKNGAIAYSYSSPTDAAELYYKSGSAAAKRLTDLNHDLLSNKTIAPVESFSFMSNDNKYEVEAFLTKPAGMTETSKHPMIVVIHGGPHGANGPWFNFKNQVYAGHGFAVLNVNYRGSTSYGQKFADAVFGDQNGNEGSGRSIRSERSSAPLFVDRSRPARNRRCELWRTTHGLAHHTDERIQGGDSDGRNFQSCQLQLHDLLQPVRRDGIWRVPASGKSDGLGLGAIRAKAHCGRAHPDTDSARRERQ